MERKEYFIAYIDKERAMLVWEEYAEDIKNYRLNSRAAAIAKNCMDSSSLAFELISLIREHEGKIISNALTNPALEDLDFCTD